MPVTEGVLTFGSLNTSVPKFGRQTIKLLTWKMQFVCVRGAHRLQRRHNFPAFGGC